MKVLSAILIIAVIALVAHAQYQRGSGYRRVGNYRQGSRFRIGDAYRQSGKYHQGRGYNQGRRYQQGSGYSQGSRRIIYRQGSRYSQGSRYNQGSGYNQGDGYSQGDRYGYKKVVCSKLSDPANGQVKLSGVRPGDKAIYTCNKGHVLVGIDTRRCLRDGKWSGEAPICKRVNCGPLPDIANGAVDVKPDTRLGSTATYSCNAGYNLVGKETRRCQASGDWSGNEPSCEPVDCGPLPDPVNGWAHTSPDTLLGAVTIYRCKLGFELSSGDRRYCQTDGTWSGSAPTCDPIDCGPQPTPDPNGQIASTDGTSLGDQTTYSCNAGFTLEGTATIYCQNDGTYSDDAPKCIPVDCGAPDPADPNGDLEVSSTTLGSRATYSCNPGFKLVGQRVAICQANGEWSSEAPICEPVDCGSLPAPKNGDVSFYPGTTFSSTATFTCKKGFKLVGSSVRTCQTTGKWSGVQPVCRRIKCPPVSPPKYGKIYTSGYYPGDYLKYDCIYGYKLSGPQRRVCLHDGVWAGRDSECVKDDYGYPARHRSYDDYY